MAALARWLTDLCSFDCETTGTDPLAARIVTATTVYLGQNGIGRDRSWLIWPGTEIPATATAVHGITSQHAREHGEQPETAVPAIAAELLSAWATGLTVVVMAAPYDLTLMQAELARNEHEPLTVGPVLDPLVIDRAMDPFRKGKRTLSALADHYKVPQDEAHSSRGDAMTAGRVVWRQAQVYRHLADMGLEQMQDLQRNAHRDWAEGYEKYLRGQGKQDVIDRDWPVRRPKGAA